MADESIKLPLTSESTRHNEGSSRRNSTGILNSPGSGETILPHYLRASTGSCHDFCKYGRKHEFEAKAIHCITRRSKTKPLDSDGQNSVDSDIIPGGMKPLGVKSKPSSLSKTQISSFEIIQQEVPTKSTGSQISKETKVYDGQNLVCGDAVPDKRKSLGAKLSASSDLKIHISDIHDVIKQDRRKSLGAKPTESSDSKLHMPDFCGIIDQEASKRSLRSQPLVQDKGKDGQKLVDKEVLSERRKSLGPKLKLSADSRSCLSISSDITEKQLSRKVHTKSSGSRKSMCADALDDKEKVGVGRRPLNNSRTNTSVSSENIKQRSPTSYGEVEVTKKQSSTVKPMLAKGATPKSKPVIRRESYSRDSSGSLLGQKITEIKTGKKTGTSKPAVQKAVASPATPTPVAVKKALASPITSTKLAAKKAVEAPKKSTPGASLKRVPSLYLRKHKNLKVGTPLKNHNKIRKEKPSEPNDDEVEEKTLYVIKMEPEKDPKESENVNCSAELCPSSPPEKSLELNSQSLKSAEVDEAESEYTASDSEDYTILEEAEVLDSKRAEAKKEEPKRTPRKVGMVVSQRKDCQPAKMHFKKGKVLDIRSEINSPRRLKFRRGKVLGENQNIKVNAQRRTLVSREEVGVESNGTAACSVKVVLRHQDVQGKKDAQGLFNYVIEETASKLAETRKSKVKALVGAFETVISLQEKKPKTNAVSGTGVGNGHSC